MFFGGEPTLFPDTIEEVCKFITRKRRDGALIKAPSFTMVTNGTLINDRIAEIVSKYHIYVTISIDGPACINDKLRVDSQEKGVFDTVSTGIEILKKWGVDVRLIEATYTVLHKESGYSREQIKEYLSSTFGVKNILVADCEEIASSHGYACDDVQDIIEFAMNNADDSIKARLIRSMNSKRRYFECSCEGGFGNLSITPGGDIYPCHAYLGHEEYLLARFMHNKYLFDENVYDVLKKGSKTNTRCEKCWARVYCSICPAIIGLAEQSLNFMCQVEKEAIKEMILKYTKSIFLNSKRKEGVINA
jgi:uncharacterized protein